MASVFVGIVIAVVDWENGKFAVTGGSICGTDGVGCTMGDIDGAVVSDDSWGVGLSSSIINITDKRWECRRMGMSQGSI